MLEIVKQYNLALKTVCSGVCGFHLLKSVAMIIIRMNCGKSDSKRKTLMLYINNSLNIFHWEELIELLNEEFIAPSKFCLDNFSDVLFKVGENVSEYYQKKLHVELALDFYLKN